MLVSTVTPRTSGGASLSFAAVSWAEVKGWQLLHGDTVQTPKNKPYSKNHFPVVRCYWYRYPDAYTNATGRTVLNLSADLKTVFVSQPWWEKDQ